MVSKKDISKKRIVLIMLALMALSVLMRFPLHRFVRDAGGDLCIDSDSGSIFLTDPDSYYHLRMTKDILEHGEAGDTMKDGIPWDSLSSAPEGRSAAGYRPLMAGICILAYRVVSAFTDVSLEQTAYWLNVFISALTLIPVFLLSLKLSSTTGAVTAGILAVLNYGYFLHSAPGFYDTDAVLCCLASSFLYSGCLLIEKLKDLKHIKPYAAAFFCLGIMLYQCWYVYYIFVFIMAAVFLAAGILKKDKLAAAASPLLIAAVFILEPQLLSDIYGTLSNMYSTGSGLFPDIYSSVAEMNRPALFGTKISFINTAGGLIPCLAGFAGFILIIVKILKKEAASFELLALIWYIVTLIPAIRSWRFIMLFAIPNAILTGYLVARISTLTGKEKTADNSLLKILLAGVTTAQALYCAANAKADSVPVFNNDEAACLISIRNNTPEDTILLDWWDRGYFFEEKAKRGTLLDGGSQSGMRCYQTAKAFASRNEHFSANIFRMLSAGGDNAMRLMLKLFGENDETLVLFDELLMGNRADADLILSGKGIDDRDKEELLSLLFPGTIPQTEVIINTQMADSAEWFAVFGMHKGSITLDRSAYCVEFNRLAVGTPKEGETVYNTDQGYSLVLKRSGDTYAAAVTDDAPFKIAKVRYAGAGGCSEYLQTEEAAETDRCLIVEEYAGVTYLSLVALPLADSVFGRMYYGKGAGLTEFDYEEELSTATSVFRLSPLQ